MSLGARLEDAWSAVGRDEEQFPDVAASLCEQHPPAVDFDRDAFLDAVLDPARSAISQLAPLGVFGQPGLTVYHGDQFVIEVYYWLNSAAAIHNHPFCGLFTLLDGYSVHVRYQVDELQRVGSRARLVKATLNDLQLMSVGDYELFSAENRPLVHALVHVPVPSISLVVRTVRTHGYMRYLPPTLAIPFEPLQEPAARRLAFLESLRLAGDPSYLERLQRELMRVDFETAVHLLAEGWGAWEPKIRAELIEFPRPRFGASVDAIVPALNDGLRVGAATSIRERLREPELRLVATTLAYADSRRRVSLASSSAR